MQQCTGRIVRAMNHTVTIHTRPATVGLAGITCQTTLPAGNIRSGRIVTGMGAVVALITQERRTGFEHRRHIGAVRVMAAGAVFSNRLMFPQEGPALIGMALVAGLVDRVFLQVGRCRSPVRVMAVGTDYFAFLDRMVRYFAAVRSLVLVTVKADLGLAGPDANRIGDFHYIVAVCTGITLGRMGTH